MQLVPKYLLNNSVISLDNLGTIDTVNVDYGIGPSSSRDMIEVSILILFWPPQVLSETIVGKAAQIQRIRPSIWPAQPGF